MAGEEVFGPVADGDREAKSCSMLISMSTGCPALCSRWFSAVWMVMASSVSLLALCAN